MRVSREFASFAYRRSRKRPISDKEQKQTEPRLCPFGLCECGSDQFRFVRIEGQKELWRCRACGKGHWKELPMVAAIKDDNEQNAR